MPQPNGKYWLISDIHVTGRNDLNQYPFGPYLTALAVSNPSDPAGAALVCRRDGPFGDAEEAEL
jgi:hypothetical protein